MLEGCLSNQSAAQRAKVSRGFSTTIKTTSIDFEVLK